MWRRAFQHVHEHREPCGEKLLCWATEWQGRRDVGRIKAGDEAEVLAIGSCLLY